ncbi:MAG TPA: 2,3,4,5-tetrahydropyridine-2,6-dicarboxylate N-succinyltransferase [Steroidobacteraceae bacterium]|nr:2,3,4,5-tetrahydropyridine-2,6-dicarboxylate N-succinyltransferase [Steroidobacteraceae bacterium]
MNDDLQNLKSAIDAAFEFRAEITPKNIPAGLEGVLEKCIGLLDSGNARVAERQDGIWAVNEWLKKAVLLYFRTRDNTVIDAGYSRFFDKVPLKYSQATEAELRASGARIVPHAIVRRGAFVAPNVVLMPSYINIGAYVGPGTMVDTWATVGSCAQIGRNVHLSGGVGIGGVLEPMQAGPTIIEDNCFIGARSEVVEGCIVREGSVLGMGVFIGKSTKIVDRATGEVFYGEVPPYSVVVAGTMPGKNIPGENWGPSLYCAVIVKHVDEKTRSKTSINELLRD